MKTKLFSTTIALLLLNIVATKAQVKVFSSGKTAVGSTSTPLGNVKLQVYGNSLFSATSGYSTSSAYIIGNSIYSTQSTPDYTWRGDSLTGMFHPAASIIGFSISGGIGEAMRLDASGRLGINTTSPTEKLDVNGLIKIPVATSTNDNSPGITSSSNDDFLYDSEYINHYGFGFHPYNDGGGSGTNSYVSGFYGIDFFTAGSERLRINNNGNVGIGSTTVSNKFEVTGGNINLVTATYAYMLGGSKILWTNNNTTSVYCGIEAGNSATGNGNSFYGNRAGYTNTTGAGNSFFGYQSGYTSNSTTANNSFFGYQSGKNTTTGTDDVFMGYQTGLTNTSGSHNTSIGNGAGLLNSTGSDNICIGYLAGYSNTASGNALIGNESGYTNTTGTANAYVGYQSGYTNSTSGYNAFIGYQAGYYNTANYNAFVGYRAGYATTTGSGNAFVGYAAGSVNTTGTRNTFMGYQAANGTTTGNYCSAFGYRAGVTNTTGTYNTFIGYGTDANAGTYTNCAAFGSNTVVTASNTIFIGDANITTIKAQVTAGTYSDGRFKINVTENVKGLTFINKLRPVTYNMDTKALDDFIIQNMPDSIKTQHQQNMNFGPATTKIHSGFIAQEVEQAAQQAGFNSSIVNTPSNPTDPYALSYAEIVVPLVKAVQELSKTTDSLKLVTQMQSEQLNACCTRGETGNRSSNPNNSKENTNDILNDKNNSSQNATGSISNSTASDAILYQNVPNPFSRETTINYFVPKDSKNASLIIFDMQGKLLKTISISVFEKGSVSISAQELNAGMYIYTLVVNNSEVASKRMIITEN